MSHESLSADYWWGEATRQGLRADAAEARVERLSADVDRLVRQLREARRYAEAAEDELEREGGTVHGPDGDFLRRPW